MTYRAIEKLIRSGRKFAETNPPHDRRAIIFCQECSKSLGEIDVFYDSLDTHWYCKECVQKFIKRTPYKVTDNIEITFDNGNSVNAKYTGGHYPELTVSKVCYFSKKGRYIKIKHGHRSKRYYI